MSVKGGDFYVGLGLKGADKTKTDLDATSKGFDTLKSSAMAAKVSMLAVFYGIEKIISTSAGLGTILAQFAAVSGVNSRISQTYSLAGQPYGVSQEEMLGQFTSIKDEMIGAKFNAQDLRPFTLAMFNALQEHGINVDLGKDALSQLAAHPEQMIQYEKQFAHLTDIPLPERTAILDQRGDSSNFQALLLSNALEEKNLNRISSLALTDKQIKELDQTNKQMIESGQVFKTAMHTGVAFLADVIGPTGRQGNHTGHVPKMAPDGSVDGKYYGYEAVIHGFKEAFKPQHFASERHLAPHVTHNKKIEINHSSKITLNGANHKDVPALKKAVSTDHTDLVSLSVSASQDR